MEPPEFILFMLAMIIPSALIFYILRRAFSLREKKLDIEALNAAEKAAQYVARSREVEARLAVVERIVTDRPTMLASEIDLLSIEKGGNA